jgi:hypothetical protein
MRNWLSLAMLLIPFSPVSVSLTSRLAIHQMANCLTLLCFLDQGQGAGVAIEDAAALAVVLPEGTSAEQVSQRLQLYQDFRYERAHKIQEYSRKAGQDIKDEDFDSQYSKDLDSALPS